METVHECSEGAQAVCEHFLRDYPDQAFALCYLFGVYRGRGLSRSEAERRTRDEMLTPSES
jgi:hypothetical protein